MNVLEGHGLLLQIPYADGAVCAYKRTFLVIGTNPTDNKVTLLNVSSVVGKTHKLLYPSNQLINNYCPPFLKPSFIKLDSIYKVEYFSGLDSAILHNGDLIDNREFRSIKKGFVAFAGSNSTVTVFYESHEVLI